MKTFLSSLTGSWVRNLGLAALLGAFALAAGPVADACCGPTFAKLQAQKQAKAHFDHAQKQGIALHCVVDGLGKDFGPAGCPGGYCPRKLNENSTALDYKGGRVYVCCPMCVEIFKKTPEKFAANANHQLVATGQAILVNCPISGQKPALSCGYLFTSKVAGVTVAFHSKECKQKVDQATPAQQLQMVFGDAGFARGFALQTKPAASAPASTTAPVTTNFFSTATTGCCGPDLCTIPTTSGCCCGKQ